MTVVLDNHSTETALITVQNDIFLTRKKKCITPRLLDFSEAIDHHILLDRLQEWFSLALDWVVSYLNHRFQSV